MAHYLHELFGAVALVLKTKKILTLDTLNGWARESLPDGGFVTVERVKDEASWIVRAKVHRADFLVVKSEAWRTSELASDLEQSFLGLPVVCRSLSKSA